MNVVLRLVIALLVSLIGWTGFTGSAAAGSALTARPATDTYDHPGNSWDLSLSSTERGLPTGYDLATTYDIVARWSHGASARHDGSTTRPTYAYDDLARFVQTTGGSPTAMERAAGDPPGLSVVWGVRVAANSERSWLGSRLALRDERGAIGGAGRGGQKLSPDPAAGGYAHSTFRRGADGSVTHYATWTPNPRSPRGHDLVKRYDGVGGAHFDKATGVYIPTPHVQGPGWVRAPLGWEIPW